MSTPIGIDDLGRRGPLYGPETDRIERKADDARWLAEGTAEYFAYILKAEINGDYNATSSLLKAAMDQIKESGTDLSAGGATSGSAAVRLLIELGDITEEQVLSASIFENCNWYDEYDDSNPAVVYVKNNWHKIIRNGDEWLFSKEALEGWR